MAAMPRILVTGASGFIGQHLVRKLSQSGYRVRAAARQPIMFDDPQCRRHRARRHVAIVRGRVYRARRRCGHTRCRYGARARSDIPDAAYTAINVDATRQLARAARAARVKRFVLMSSVRAQVGPRIRASSRRRRRRRRPTPTAARKSRPKPLRRRLLEGSATRWTVLRPVLVYGPGQRQYGGADAARGACRMPLPLAALKSRRSLLSIGNLLAAIGHVLQTETAENTSFIVADERAGHRGRDHPGSAAGAAAGRPCFFRCRKRRSRRRCDLPASPSSPNA